MTEAITLDEIDTTAASAFEGYVVRKDLAQQFKGAYPVPTYVGEFLIGRYCATTDPEEIEEGLKVVRRLLADRTVRAGEVFVEIHLRGVLLGTVRLKGDSSVVVFHGHIHVLGFKVTDRIRGRLLAIPHDVANNNGNDDEEYADSPNKTVATLGVRVSYFAHLNLAFKNLRTNSAYLAHRLRVKGKLGEGALDGP